MIGIFEFNPTTGNFTQISEDQTAPLKFNFNGSEGGIVRKKLYIRNDETTFYYTDIRIEPSPSVLVSPENTRHFTYKLLSGDAEPIQTLWDARRSGDPLLSIADMSLAPTREYYILDLGKAGQSDTTYYPFWFEVGIPSHTPVLTELNITLVWQAEEQLV